MQLIDKFCSAYINGVVDCLQFATPTVDSTGRMRCPCHDCNNGQYIPFRAVKTHLHMNGINPTYTTWEHHGEPYEQVSKVEIEVDQDVGNMTKESNESFDGVQDILGEMYRATFTNAFAGEGCSTSHETNHEADDGDKFVRL